MATKKFKTVAGYLRSAGSNLHDRQQRAKTQGMPAISDADGLRQIINNLLPHIGITDCIYQDESPRDGVERLRAAATNDGQIKALTACAKWVVNPYPHVWTVTTSSSVSHISKGESHED